MHDTRVGPPLQYYRDYVLHYTRDDFWKPTQWRDTLGGAPMPMLLTGGWYDNYAAETAANFLALRQQAPTPELRDSHRMIIGPWPHGINSTSVLGEIDFGHPLFVPFASPRYSDFTKIHFWRHTSLAIAPESSAQVAARFDNGEPAFIDVPVGKGRALVFASGCWAGWKRGHRRRESWRISAGDACGA